MSGLLEKETKKILLSLYALCLSKFLDVLRARLLVRRDEERSSAGYIFLKEFDQIVNVRLKEFSILVRDL